ncbi:Metallo-hydrolase/oxidoreductase [Amylostereum chailletii]|nr:Metallo-hydrolase/oxidoreductase [Amylostereum chailletii]
MSQLQTLLPQPAESQSFFTLAAMEAGRLVLPGTLYVDPCPATTPKWEIPSLAFLLRHSSTGDYFLLDLGIRKDHDKLPPATVRMMKEYAPITVERDIAERLKEGGLDPAAVKHVCLSHAHFDHIGDPELFPSSTFVVGGPTRGLLQNGFPADPEAGIASALLPPARTVFLEDDDARWAPLGPFERALDFFGDGSLFIVEALGHMPGHVNVLARTSVDGAWVYLAGDSAHDWRLVEGTAKVAELHCADGVVLCGHGNKVQAERHIGRIAELMKVPRVRVMLAHDLPWWEENKASGMWPMEMPSL